jgi:hypothetical protein
MWLDMGQGLQLAAVGGHQALAGLIPLQAGGQGRVEPPTDPLHRCGETQDLGDRQTPGPAGMGGIKDHRRASRGRHLVLPAALAPEPGSLGHGSPASRPHSPVWLALPADWQEHPVLRHTARELGQIGGSEQLEG